MLCSVGWFVCLFQSTCDFCSCGSASCHHEACDCYQIHLCSICCSFHCCAELWATVTIRVVLTWWKCFSMAEQIKAKRCWFVQFDTNTVHSVCCLVAHILFCFSLKCCQLIWRLSSRDGEGRLGLSHQTSLHNIHSRSFNEDSDFHQSFRNTDLI